MIRPERMSTAASEPECRAWKCGGACSLTFMVMMIPKKREISGMAGLATPEVRGRRRKTVRGAPPVTHGVRIREAVGEEALATLTGCARPADAGREDQSADSEVVSS